MPATILIPGPLRGDTDGAAMLSVASDGTLGSVLQEVVERWPRLGRRICDEQGRVRRYINIYVNGEDVRGLDGLDSPVPDGAEVQVLPSVAGG
jgi:sulfur-carrier protein